MNFLEYKPKEVYTKVWYRQRSYLTGAHLKYIAMFFMLLSHLAQTGFIYGLGNKYYVLADIFVFLGRISMPIFCFFTVQAVIYTKDFRKYMLRMFIFSLISEIPFDLALYGTPFYWESQNVIFTLLMGAITVYGIDYLRKSNYNVVIKVLAGLLIIILARNLSLIMRTDYNVNGIVAIVLLYLAKDNKLLTALALLIAFYFEFRVFGYAIPISYGFVYLSIPLIMLYNGQKGKQNKWAFYIFYPAHLLLIYLLKLLIL
ncbi:MULTISPECIES: TraX family protein [Anaerococcus]|uniref:TraX family protein n=2 Tax=Anaerococcus TaxID=165779 RepID=A0ABW9MWB1_9FIRM